MSETKEKKILRGRPKKQIHPEQIKDLVDRGYTFSEMADDLNVSVSYMTKVWSDKIWEWRGLNGHIL